MILEAIYWMLLVLIAVRAYVPEKIGCHGWIVEVVLFVILGLRVFGVPH